MIYHQKTTQYAISAMSRLAELYEERSHIVSAREISDSRQLPAPVVAKILTELSRGGLVKGSPGPGGGYRLAKPPSEISLKDVVVLFERENDSICPFGPNWCGVREPCPLHHSLVAMKQIFDDYLKNTTLTVFQRKSTNAEAAPLPPAPSVQDRPTRRGKATTAPKTKT